MRHFLSEVLIVLFILFASQVWAADKISSADQKEAAGYYRGECTDLSSLPAKEKELVAFVCKAKAFAFANIKIMGETKGLAAAFKEFRRQAGEAQCLAGKCPFQQGELYIYAYENEKKGDRVVRIICRANGANPTMVGKDFFNTGYAMKAYPQYGIKTNPDAKFFRMVSDAAYRENGNRNGFVLFTWPKPSDENRIWLKKGYSTKITESVWIGSGIYMERVH